MPLCRWIAALLATAWPLRQTAAATLPPGDGDLLIQAVARDAPEVAVETLASAYGDFVQYGITASPPQLTDGLLALWVALVAGIAAASLTPGAGRLRYAVRAASARSRTLWTMARRPFER